MGNFYLSIFPPLHLRRQLLQSYPFFGKNVHICPVSVDKLLVLFITFLIIRGFGNLSTIVFIVILHCFLLFLGIFIVL